jgi:hypothetical protein
MPREINLPAPSTGWEEGQAVRFTYFSPEELAALNDELWQMFLLEGAPNWTPDCRSRLQSMHQDISNLNEPLASGEWEVANVTNTELADSIYGSDVIGLQHAQSILSELHPRGVLMPIGWKRMLDKARRQHAGLSRGCGAFNVGAGVAVLGGMVILAGAIAVYNKRSRLRRR